MPQTIVIFGASGDLTSRKLIPALFSLHRKGRLPQGTRIIGFSRTAFSHEAWRNQLRKSTEEHSEDGFDGAAWQTFAPTISYQPGDIANGASFTKLTALADELEGGEPATRLYYLATMPSLYGPAAEALGAAGLAKEDRGPRRVVIEKPFGTDLASAKALNKQVHRVFDEHQVYRIDHYLGKETVQNLLVLRFANSIFEPIWNRNYVDHVQITVAEEVLVGSRAGYYDHAGVLRDMFQNHILQLLMITAMEAPARYDADLVRDEKVKVLRSVRRQSAEEIAAMSVRGQYRTYAQEKDVPQGSQTATFAALRLDIDNWRWTGVPFYLRSGKGMSCRTTQIVIQFRQPPHLLFESCKSAMLDSNRLVIQIQPAEGIQLHFLTKVPDSHMQLRLTDLDFRFSREFAGSLPDAYQRLLLDALNGDASHFARSDEVEQAWSLIDPIHAAWHGPAAPALHLYEPGLWGPEEAMAWMAAQGREWFDVCPVLH